MGSVEDIKSAIDAIGAALQELDSDEGNISTPVEEFQNRVLSYFPKIELNALETSEEENQKDITPLWWDDLDEPFELDPLNWLTKIQKIELLSHDVVPGLMEDVEAGILAEGFLNQDLSNEESLAFSEAELLRIVAKGQKAFETVVTHNLKLIIHIARRYGRRVELEDAFSYGVFGLLQAIKKFDWRLGNQISTYATWWIRQALTRNIADFGTTINVPVHANEKLNTYERERREFEAEEFTIASDVTIMNRKRVTVGNESAKSPPIFQPIIDETLRCAIEATTTSYDFWDVFHEAPWLLSAVEVPRDFDSGKEFRHIAEDLTTRLTAYVLSSREAEVVLYRHGYIGGEPLTLDDIGKKFGLTRERIRQIENKAMDKVAKFISGVNLDNYWDVIEDRTTKYLWVISQELETSSPKKKSPKPYFQKKKLTKSRVDEPSTVSNSEALIGSNLERTRRASEVQVKQLKWALEVLKDEEVPPIWSVIARARIENPELSYAQIARMIGDGLSKDAVAGAIRRTIERAKRISP